MPKLSVSPTEKARRNIRGKIRAGMELQSLSSRRLAEKTGMPYSTLCRKINDPLSFTIGDVIRIEKAIGLRILGGEIDERVS